MPRSSTRNTRPRILAVASGGGHWVQLMRLRPAFEDADVTYVTVQATSKEDVPETSTFHVVPDATRWDRIRLVRMALRLFWIALRTRPDVVISTGAAPGYFALRFGRWLGARTMWIDSIANAEKLSMSATRIKPHATMVLSQWKDVAERNDVEYHGAVL